MATPLRALIIQKSEIDTIQVVRLLTREGYAVANERVDSLEGIRASLLRQAWDIVIADSCMPGLDGFAALAVVRQHDPEMPFLVVSSAVDETAAVDMMKAGASDYITRRNLARLVPAVQRELRHAKTKQDSCEAAAALRESNERFRQLADNIREVFWLTDPFKSEVLYISPGYEAIWGRKPETLYARPRDWVEAIHPEDRDRVVEAALTKQARGDYEEEYRITRPDGEMRWIRDRAFVVLGEGGRVTRIAGVAEDITERKHAADASRESERRFSDMLRNVELVSLMLDSEARITYCNDYLLRITGWKREEVLGRDWFEVFIPPSLTDMKELFAALLLNRSSAWHHENDILTRAGGLRTIRWNNTVLLSASGEPIGTASIGEDVTERRHAELELRRSECIKSAILQSSLDCVITIDHEGQIIEFNPAAETTFGLTRQHAVGKSMVDLIVPPDMRDAHRCGFARHLATGEGRLLGKRLEFRAIRADGTEFPVELAITSMQAASRPLFTAFIRDITARKEAEEKIKRLNRVYEVLSGINSLIMRVRDRNELFRDSCRLIVEAGRFSLAWIAMPDSETMQLNAVAWAGNAYGFVDRVRDRLSLRDPPQAQSLAVRAAITKSPFVSNDIRGDSRIKFAQEHVQFNSRSVGAFPIVVGDDVAAVLVLHYPEAGFFDDDEIRLLLDLCGNIAFALEHIKKSEQVHYLAYYDVLTGLANRTLFRERLQQKLTGTAHLPGKIAVFLLDLEHFKTINDALGWHVGDELLKQVAQRLVSVGRDEAARFARISADIFAILVGDVENEQQLARFTEERLNSVFKSPYLVGAHELRIGAKCGIAIFPDDGIDADTLLRHAEAALKRAKASGERYIFYAQEMTERVAEKLTLDNKLRQALDRDEFVLHYQPKVDVTTRRIVGVEALLRWQSSELGLVSPLKFIPLLEETGLILQVGAWALKQAALDRRSWIEQGLKAPRVAVNVSQIQLRQRDFVQIVEQAVVRDVAPTGIDLEITESLVMEDIESNIEKLNLVRKLGVKFAIDDFGTGYSSLAYLSKLPVETLKIDRVFITAMLDDPNSAMLVQTMITLAHSLRLKVVAEGVETEEQAMMLRLLRCDEMQGFLVSRPLPAEEIGRLFLSELYQPALA